MEVTNIDSITYRRQVGNREEIWRTYWTEEWAPASYKIAEKFWIPVKFSEESRWKRLIATIIRKMKGANVLSKLSQKQAGPNREMDFASLDLPRRLSIKRQ